MQEVKRNVEHRGRQEKQRHKLNVKGKERSDGGDKERNERRR